MQSLRIAAPLAGLAFLITACDSPTPPAPGSPQLGHVPGVATGRAQLHPQNQSGVKGVIEFTDDGTDLTVNGTATGLDPAGIYVSLIYDNQSVPGGPLACEPMIFDPTDPGFILTTMFVGFWVNNGDGTGTLAAVNIVDDTGDRVHVPLDKFRTISIRDLRINNGFGPDAVVACGQEATHPAG